MMILLINNFKKMKKSKTAPEIVLIGKNYNSIERAKERKKYFLANGYKILTENSKKITFVKK